MRGQRPTSLQDPQIDRLRANLAEVFGHLLDQEHRAGLVLWLLLGACALNVGLMVRYAWLRYDVLFVLWSNATVFAAAAYFRKHRKSKVAQRFVGLVNNALSSCYLQLRQLGARVELRSLANEE